METPKEPAPIPTEGSQDATPAPLDSAESAASPEKSTHDADFGGGGKPGFLAKAKALVRDLFESLFSDDAPTRRTSVLFFLSVFGLVVVSVIGVKRISAMRARHAEELRQQALLEKEQQELYANRLSDLKAREAVVELGRFVVSLQSRGREKSTADFDLFVRCSDKQVREYVETHSVQVRSEITSALVGMVREDFLAVDGKRRTHKKILLVLNQWLAREYSGARIEEIWFTDLVVE